MPELMKRTWDIEGMEWAGDNHWKMWEFLEKRELQYIRQKGEHFYIDHNQCKGGLVIKTPKGDRPVNLGDFVIRTINGDYITCRADLFHSAGFKCLTTCMRGRAKRCPARCFCYTKIHTRG